MKKIKNKFPERVKAEIKYYIIGEKDKILE